jgi:hypothetical protein
MIYLWNKNGEAVFYGTLEGAKIDGFENPDLTVEERVFEEAEGLVRIIDGEFFFGKTEEEKTEERKLSRKFEIEKELEKIDFQSVRSVRAISSGNQTDADIQKLSELEEKAESLRKELKSL